MISLDTLGEAENLSKSMKCYVFKQITNWLNYRISKRNIEIISILYACPFVAIFNP